MAAIARGQSSGCSNPLLDVFFQVNGVTTDVGLLEYIIYEKVTDPGVPTQVYPAAEGDRATVDLGLCGIGAGGKITTGRYVADFTPAIDAPLGTWSIRWFFKLSVASPEQTFSEEFEVIPEVSAYSDNGYCTVKSLRDEGVPVSFTDSYLMAKIARWSRWIDKITGRFFEARELTISLDGSGGRAQLLEIPIISVTEVVMDSSPFSPSDLPIDADLFRVYNRHLTQGLTNPDDRDNPKIEFFHTSDDILASHASYSFTRLIWPRGQHNITLTGIFGYTDPDGSPTGGTPYDICELCKLLVLRDIHPKYSSADKSADAMSSGRIKRMKTRDQEIEYHNSMSLGAGNAFAGAFTGDPAIDSLIAMYMRPPHLGAV